ncbi:hypothetical protein BDC45DRAFT_493151 [Circinella umbellata]|nr:hypothetical protein BDC45DRAFT_493151 [Circinella umbellata]
MNKANDLYVYLVANHGGRYLYVDQNNEVLTDTNLDLSTPPEDLASKGDTFSIDDKNRLLMNDKPVTLTTKITPKGRSTKFGLILEQANSEEYVIRTADRKKNHRYVFAGLEKLKVQDEPNAMSMFSVVKEDEQQNNDLQEQDQQSSTYHADKINMNNMNTMNNTTHNMNNDNMSRHNHDSNYNNITDTTTTMNSSNTTQHSSVTPPTFYPPSSSITIPMNTPTPPLDPSHTSSTSPHSNHFFQF